MTAAEQELLAIAVFRPLAVADVEHGTYLATPTPCHGGKVWINPRLLADLASGRNVLVIEGAVREGLAAAGWIEIVSDLFVRGNDTFAEAYLRSGRRHGPSC